MINESDHSPLTLMQQELSEPTKSKQGTPPNHIQPSTPLSKFSVFPQPIPLLGNMQLTDILGCILYKNYIHPFLSVNTTFTDFFEIGLTTIFRDILSRKIFDMTLLTGFACQRSKQISLKFYYSYYENYQLQSNHRHFKALLPSDSFCFTLMLA